MGICSLCQDRNMICKQRPCLQIVIFAFLAIASNHGESVEHSASEVQGVSEKDQTSKELYEDKDQNNSSVLELDQPTEELFEDQYQINEDQYYDDEDVAEVDKSEEMVEERIFEEPDLNEETNDFAEDQDQDNKDVPEDETDERKESKMKKLLSLLW